MNTSTFGRVTTPPAHGGCAQLPFLHVDCWHCRPVHGPGVVPPPNPPSGWLPAFPPPPLDIADPGEKLQPPKIVAAATTITRALVMAPSPRIEAVRGAGGAPVT